MERKFIFQEEGTWRVVAGLDAIGIPATLQGLLLARIDRLEEEVRTTLQMASVIGKSFLYRILESISDAKRELDSHLSQLQRVDMVREKARLPELEYIFRQTLTQEAAYESLLHERRKEFHLKVGEALEILFEDRKEEFLGLLAYHFEAAEEHEQATEYLIQAGDQSRLSLTLKEAVDYYSRAIALLKNKADYEKAAKVLMRLGLAYHNDYKFLLARQAFDEGFVLRQQTNKLHQEELPLATLPYTETSLPLHTLDPMISTDMFSGRIIRCLFSGLVEQKPEMGVGPDLARSWDISEDGCKYVFHLRDDVFWSDGVQVTADDCTLPFFRLLDPMSRAIRIKESFILNDLKGGNAYYSGEVKDPEEVGVRAIDDLTLEIELSRPVYNLLQELTAHYVFPIPRHVYEIHGDAWTDVDNIVTNGPLRLKSYIPDEFIRMERNPTYHGRFAGNLQKFEVKLKEQNVLEQLQMYKDNEIDVVKLFNETYHARLKYIDEYGSRPINLVRFVGFNIALPPFDDVNVRRAFAMSVDKQNLAYKILDGEHDPALGGFIPPGMIGHSPDIGLQYDPEEARNLLELAGYPDGVGFPNLELIWVEESLVINHLIEHWGSNLNVQVKLNIAKWEEYIDNFQKGILKEIYYGGARYDDDDTDGDSVLRVGVRLFLAAWHNENYYKLMEQARQIPKIIDRTPFVQQADKVLIDDAGVIPLLYQRQHYLIKPWIKFPYGFRDHALKEIIIEPH
jgi:oligopeptide transport system substrate-binding protein